MKNPDIVRPSTFYCEGRTNEPSGKDVCMTANPTRSRADDVRRRETDVRYGADDNCVRGRADDSSQRTNNIRLDDICKRADDNGNTRQRTNNIRPDDICKRADDNGDTRHRTNSIRADDICNRAANKDDTRLRADDIHLIADDTHRISDDICDRIDDAITSGYETLGTTDQRKTTCFQGADVISRTCDVRGRLKFTRDVTDNIYYRPSKTHKSQTRSVDQRASSGSTRPGPNIASSGLIQIQFKKNRSNKLGDTVLRQENSICRSEITGDRLDNIRSDNTHVKSDKTRAVSDNTCIRSDNTHIRSDNTQVLSKQYTN